MASSPAFSPCPPCPAERPAHGEGVPRFDTLVREHGPALLSIAYRLCGNRSDALDLVQDTFERGLRSFSRFEPGTNSRAWLATILGNLFIDRCRARVRQERVGGAAVPIDEELVAEPPAEEAPAWGAITVDQVREALASLGEGFRVVYELHSLEGYSYNEIAERLGIPRATVGTRLNRARRRLRELLAPRCEAMAA